MKKLIFLLIVLFVPSIAHASNSVYLAQASAGGNTGVDCADAKAVSYFNTSGNWSATPTGVQIGPGTTVFLCGSSVTTNLTFQGNGSAGGSSVCGFAATACTPVILDGTNLTAMNAFISPNTQYWIIQNITWSTSYATNSSTQAVIQTSNGAAYGTIQNNHMDVINSAQNIFFHGVTHDIAILNNYLKISTVPSDGFDTDIIDTEGGYNVLFQGNYAAMNIGSGDSGCGGCHDDLIQTWSSVCPSLTAHSCTHDWTIRYNEFVQESSSAITNNLSFFELEGIAGGSPGNFDIYSNVFLAISGGSSGNGVIMDGNGISGGNTSNPTVHLIGNTEVQYSGGQNNLWNVSGGGNFIFENNITYNVTAGNACNSCGMTTRDHNLWYGPNTPTCTGHAGEICGSNPLFTNYSGQVVTLTSSSPARNAGTSVSAPYNVGLDPSATWPNPSTTTFTGDPTNVDIGAYPFSASNPQAATPSCSPGVSGGNLFATGAQSITCTLSSGDHMCDTVDGTMPATDTASGCSNGTVLASGGTVSIPWSETLKVIGGGTGFSDGSVASYQYTLTNGFTGGHAKASGTAIIR